MMETKLHATNNCSLIGRVVVVVVGDTDIVVVSIIDGIVLEKMIVGDGVGVAADDEDGVVTGALVAEVFGWELPSIDGKVVGMLCGCDVTAVGCGYCDRFCEMVVNTGVEKFGYLQHVHSISE